MAEIDYKEFNDFQNKFYLNINEFKLLSLHEVKKHGYTLLNNLGKGYPYLANLILNLQGIGWSGPESHQILIALQRKFINSFNLTRLPKSIFWKGIKSDKQKEKVKKTDKGLEFSSDIEEQIKSILFYDSKTFERFKYNDNVQNLGKQIIGQIIQSEKIKSKIKK
ncbi:hypothetical protein M0Q97_02275 [Candidatus Dojkabacteria bacterium]|jgi:hypothetical protein|nr:hypothetical protein [Candidatus Dojkabacteria bacterium]